MEAKQIVVSDSIGARGSAHIKISPDGQYLYASNRLEGDGIAIFAVSSTEGTLTKAGYQPTGKHPRHFEFTPDGRYLLVACRDEHKIQVFRHNPENGLLTDTRQNILFPISKSFKLESIQVDNKGLSPQAPGVIAHESPVLP